MKNNFSYLILFLFAFNFLFIACAKQQKSASTKTEKIIKIEAPLKIAADRTALYLNKLKGKNVAIVANQTSVLTVSQRAEVAPNVMGSKLVQHHLVDYLHSYNNINVQKVFAPEHGFRGKADAGETVVDGIDTKTQLPIISLYGKNKKPSPAQLKNIDVVVFDIQDVGARFYTYISSLHYVMEACAEQGIEVILLDRPNPNGHYIDGPTLEVKHKSFVGMHPVPVVYGMTIGEYGQMINGEKWLKDGIQCNLTVIPLNNYTHNTQYSLPIKPSPNLPNDKSINLYPSLCFFEGTNVSVGRGTEMQFQVVGSPLFSLKNDFSFTPNPNFGSKYPKHQNIVCYGYSLTENERLNALDLKWLLTFYKDYSNFKNEQGYPYKESFFNTFFTNLTGTEKLQQQIEQGLNEEEIKATWANDLEKFKIIREKYLIYK